jgi:hypothetical protein
MPAPTQQFQVRPIWLGGPSRIWSPYRRSGASLPTTGGGFLGAYVGQQCKKPCPGVFRISQGLEVAEKWLCGGCVNRSESL